MLRAAAALARQTVDDNQDKIEHLCPITSEDGIPRGWDFQARHGRILDLEAVLEARQCHRWAQQNVAVYEERRREAADFARRYPADDQIQAELTLAERTLAGLKQDERNWEAVVDALAVFDGGA